MRPISRIYQIKYKILCKLKTKSVIFLFFLRHFFFNVSYSNKYITRMSTVSNIKFQCPHVSHTERNLHQITLKAVIRFPEAECNTKSEIYFFTSNTKQAEKTFSFMLYFDSWFSQSISQ